MQCTRQFITAHTCTKKAVHKLCIVSYKRIKYLLNSTKWNTTDFCFLLLIIIIVRICSCCAKLIVCKDREHNMQWVHHTNSPYMKLHSTTMPPPHCPSIKVIYQYSPPSMKNSLRSHASNNKVYGRWDEDTMDREISMLKIFVCIINSSNCLIFITEHTNKAEME